MVFWFAYSFYLDGILGVLVVVFGVLLGVLGLLVGVFYWDIVNGVLVCIFF